eukprot:711914-Prorocentrum_minimum.AAC.3
MTSLQPAPTHYATLGAVVCASVKDLAKAYRKRALECHPDKGGDEAAFQAVQKAYEILKDAARRAEYDKLLLATRRKEIRQSEEEKKKARERAFELERIRRLCESNADDFWQQQRKATREEQTGSEKENPIKMGQKTGEADCTQSGRSPLQSANQQRIGSSEEGQIEPSQRIVYIAGKCLSPIYPSAIACRLASTARCWRLSSVNLGYIPHEHECPQVVPGHPTTGSNTVTRLRAGAMCTRPHRP